MTEPTLTKQEGQAYLANRLTLNNPFEESFVYNVKLDTLAHGESVPVALAIQSDSDFEWAQSSIQMSLDNVEIALEYLSADRYPGILVQISDGASQVPLSNIPVPTSAIFGTGKQPRILPQKRIVERNSVLVFTFSNIYTSNAGNMNNLVVSLIGAKLYRGFKQ